MGGKDVKRDEGLAGKKMDPVNRGRMNREREKIYKSGVRM